MSDPTKEPNLGLLEVEQVFLTTLSSLQHFYTLAIARLLSQDSLHLRCSKCQPNTLQLPNNLYHVRSFQWYSHLTAQYKVQTRRFKVRLGPLLTLSCLLCLCCLTGSSPDRAHLAARGLGSGGGSIRLCSLTSSRKPGGDQASDSTGEGKICPLRTCLRAPSSLLLHYPPLPPDLVKLFFLILPFPCPCTLIPTTLIQVLEHAFALSLRSILPHNCHVLT